MPPVLTLRVGVKFGIKRENRYENVIQGTTGFFATANESILREKGRNEL